MKVLKITNEHVNDDGLRYFLISISEENSPSFMTDFIGDIREVRYDNKRTLSFIVCPSINAPRWIKSLVDVLYASEDAAIEHVREYYEKYK